MSHNYYSDTHYGKEIFTKRFFYLKQKDLIPIIGLVSLGIVIMGATSIKNLRNNPNVTLMHSHLGQWGKTELNTFDLAKNHRPLPATIFPEESEDL
jgi:hypothetical protein